MKRSTIVAVGAAGIVVLLICGSLLWPIFGPSVIVIQNVGDQPTQLVLTDADHITQVWSGELKPGRRKTVIAWFKYEGGLELRCRDLASHRTAQLGYVTGYMPMNAEIEIAGCNDIKPSNS